VTVYSPYEAFVFEWVTLKKASTQVPEDPDEKLACEDLQTLLQVMSGGNSGDERLDKYFQSGNVYIGQATITVDVLWTIFPPEILIYSEPFQNEPQIFIVQDNGTPWPVRGDKSRFLP
jgi:hypothetical protein